MVSLQHGLESMGAVRTAAALAVPTISEITNVLLMRGMIGKPGAGLCPVRGHSNVQGDRTMGIWEKMPEKFLAALDPGSVSSARASTASTPSTPSGRCATGAPTVQVSTKLNRSHVVHGATALILPSLGRTDRDIQGGAKQQVSVEDSMSMVHLSRGSLHPPSDQVRSEVAIVCQLARTLLGPDIRCRGSGSKATTTPSATRSPPWCPAAPTTTARSAARRLPAAARPRDSREFPTSTGKANFAVNPLEWVPVPEGRLVLQTLRSHDQYNTTIYGLDDRYRGVKGGWRVVFVNPADIERSACPTVTGSTWCRSSPGDGHVQERARRTSLVVGTRPRSATPRPTIRRPIPLCRWITPRPGPIRRCRRPSSSGWSAAMGRVTARRRAAPRDRRRSRSRGRRRWSSRSRWRSGSTARRSPSPCARPARMSNWRKAFCSPRASSPAATTCSPCGTARAPADDGLEHLQRARRDAGARRPDARRRCHPQLLHHLVVRGLRQGVTGRGATISRHCPGDDPVDGGRRDAIGDAGASCAPRRRCSPAPAGCTARRCSPPTAPCSSSARTSAGTTPSTRSSAGRWKPDRIPLTGTVLLVSGRASFELTQKAVMAGIPVLAAVSAPSSLAVDLASQSGLTLVAFLRGDSMNVYTRPDRVTPGGMSVTKSRR